MLFHSWHFAVFFLVTYFVYLALRRTGFWLHWLLAASYFFYGWWNPLYLLLIAYSTAVNFYAVVLMQRGRRKRLWLVVGVINSLAVLAFFKYAGFVAQNLNVIFSWLELPLAIPDPEGAGILLPVGISFYTFQSLSYTIDFYRGRLDGEPSLIRFATFVALFPQLVAGPIERAGNLLPQLTEKPALSRTHISDGLSLFLVGLFKKVALADYLALYVDQVYAAPGLHDGGALLLATFAFGWQIYFDFSGYTDMARGVAKTMGFELMLNFRNPYLADSLGDFWQRWHISLSTWFKDYVYVPLGGNRKGAFNTYRNMCLTMVISGLWHGAAWGFVIWGALHAVGRCLTRELEQTGFYRDRVPRIVKQLLVFAFVTFCWIFFRAESLSDAGLIVLRIFTSGFSDPRFPLLMLSMILSVWIYQFVFESRYRKVVSAAPVRVGIAVLLTLYLCVSSGGTVSEFIYFQF